VKNEEWICKGNRSELIVCFDAVHHVLLYVTDNKF